jgi:phosphomannomutase
MEASQPLSPVVPTAPPSVTPATPTLREALSKMTLDVFVYTDVEADRMAVINGRRYFKGQFVDGLYLVESINPDGVMLKYRDERAVLRP